MDGERTNENTMQNRTKERTMNEKLNQNTTHKWTSELMKINIERNECTNGRMNKQTNARTSTQTKKRTNARPDKWTNGCSHKVSERSTDVRTNKVNERTHGRKHEQSQWTNIRTNERELWWKNRQMIKKKKEADVRTDELMEWKTDE